MHGVKEIIDEASSLPVDERVSIVDALLRTLNPPNPENDAVWAEVAKRRLAEIRSGQARTIPIEKVFAKIRDHLSR